MTFLKKLRHYYIWERIFFERLTEPLHLNLASLFVLAFGSFESRVNFDLVIRPHNAFGILKAARQAKSYGFSAVSVLEFGVASGAGLMNMAKIAEQVTKVTGVQVKIYGFDTGKGLPLPKDYRDHPDLYQEGDFVGDFDKLARHLPSNAKLVMGDVAETVPEFLRQLPRDEPIGYAVIDVDYYCSTRDALRVFAGPPETCMPIVSVYLDDITSERHNSACGELLAIAEFNRENPMRLIERHAFFDINRVFRRAKWIRQLFYLHVLDHPNRASTPTSKKTLENVYLS